MATTFEVKFSDRATTTVAADNYVSSATDVLFYNRGVTPGTWTVVAGYVAGVVNAIKPLP